MQNPFSRLLKVRHSKFTRNLGIALAETIVTKSLSFLTIVLLGRMLGPTDYGKYSFIFVTVTFCTTFFDFGMENTAIRFSSRDKQHSNAIFGLYFIIKILSLLFLIAVFLGFGDQLFTWLNKPS